MPFKSPAVVMDILAREDAVSLLTAYQSSYTGRLFEVFVGRSDPYRFTAVDALSVASLSVEVPVAGMLALIDDTVPGYEMELSGLLRDIPPNARPWHSEDWLGDDSPVQRLWSAVRSIDNVGRTIASKLLCAKRPGLIPIFDSRVGATLLENPQRDYVISPWREFYGSEMAKDGIARAREIAQLAGARHLTEVRTIDIVVWMNSKNRPDA